MRLKFSPAIVIALLLALTFPSFVAAQSSAARYADDALRLAPVLIGLFGGLSGLAAVIVAGLYARENKSDSASAKGLACVVAAIGGIALSLSLLGLTLLGLLGTVLFAGAGVFVCLLIAES